MRNRKKQFVREVVGDSASSSELKPEQPTSHDHRVYFKQIRVKSIDFSRWYGGGINQIAKACQDQIERFLAGIDAEYAHTTIKTFCQSGLRTFLEYGLLRAAALGRDLELLDVNRDFMDGYIGFLQTKQINLLTKSNRYSSVKPVLKALCDRGLIIEVHGGDDETFPRNPFPGAQRNAHGPKPLTTSERKALSTAVKTAVMPLFSEDVEPTSYLLACALLVIALHTGRNTTPLIELSRDCLRPHPKSGVQFLVVFKRRAHSESKVALQDRRVKDNDLESVATLRPTVVGLIRRVLTLSERLRMEAMEEINDSVWLYRMRTHGRGTGKVGDVRALDEKTLGKAIRKLVTAYDLKDAEGKPMQISVGRLRTSFINRVYEILDENIVATAAAAGNTVRVAGISYLKPSEEAVRNWLFMGLALTSELLSGSIGATERTPVARCSDPKNGEYAPKRNELICTSFLNCLRCRNMVVTADDLYRLFSFYWRVLRERASIDPRRWKRHLSHIVRLIDRDVIEAGIAQGVFKRKAVDEERRRAFSNPHPFWRADVALADLSALGSL